MKKYIIVHTKTKNGSDRYMPYTTHFFGLVKRPLFRPATVTTYHGTVIINDFEPLHSLEEAKEAIECAKTDFVVDTYKDVKIARAVNGFYYCPEITHMNTKGETCYDVCDSSLELCKEGIDAYFQRQANVNFKEIIKV